MTTSASEAGAVYKQATTSGDEERRETEATTGAGGKQGTIATTCTTDEKAEFWIQRAKELGIADPEAFHDGVDPMDSKANKLLYKKFGVDDEDNEDHYVQRGQLLGFVKRYQQRIKEERERRLTEQAAARAQHEDEERERAHSISPKKRTESSAALPSSDRPLKKFKDGTAKPVAIKTGMTVELQTRKIAALNEGRVDIVHYFGRDGAQELFDELVLPRKELEKKHKSFYNISLIGHPGAGKSTLAWAVAHQVANGPDRESVLWLSRRAVGGKWTVRLFEWDEQEGASCVYRLYNVPEDIKEILEDELVKNVTLVILDSPTKANTESARAGHKAFEWAEEDDEGIRRVIHVSSLGAFSLDGRILNEHFLFNLRMAPWNQTSFIRSLDHSQNLRNQVIDTLTEGCPTTAECNSKRTKLATLSSEELVDTKFFFSGINARWFFNQTIESIKQECRNHVSRMGEPSTAESAVNSVSVDLHVGCGRYVKVYTSAFMVCALSDKSTTQGKFRSLFPLVSDRLGNGSPGEVFEFEFCANIEHSHNLLEAERRMMDDKSKCEEIRIGLGTDIETKAKISWRAGKLLRLPRGTSYDTAAHPMPKDLDAKAVDHYWVIPEDKSQPFLDFFFLESAAEGKYTLRVLQNTISGRHC